MSSFNNYNTTCEWTALVVGTYVQEWRSEFYHLGNIVVYEKKSKYTEGSIGVAMLFTRFAGSIPARSKYLYDL